jgi:hypothetical protein
MLRTIMAGAAAIGALAASPASRAENKGKDGTWEKPAGVIGLDVYAQGRTVDVLTAVATEAGVDLRHQRSVDGGRTWGKTASVGRGTQGVTSIHRGMDAQIAAHKDRIVVVWTVPGTDPWGGGPLGTSVSNDAGRTWWPAGNPADDGKMDGHGFIDAIADGAGAFHVVWLDEREGQRGLRGATSTDGRTWTANRTIDGRTCECCWNKLATVAADTVQVLYRDKAPVDMAIAATQDSGRTWKRLATVGDFKWAFDGCPHVGGGLGATVDARGQRRLHATAWTAEEKTEGLYYLQSADMGKTWSTPRRVASAAAKHSDLATDGRRLLITWEMVEGSQDQILTALSEDAGSSWAAPQGLATGVSPSHPLAVASDGRFLVFWTERPAQGAPSEWRMAEVGGPATRHGLGRP